jgi:hypothetical protein
VTKVFKVPEDSEDTQIGEQAGRTLVSPHLKRALAFCINCLRGVGQVFFMNNPLSGLVILAGLFVQSPRVATYGTSPVCVAVWDLVTAFVNDVP